MTPLSLFLPDEEASTRFGALLAHVLRTGDTVLLSGPIGAGKTHVARAFIQARLGRLEEVPSPTFTLVQTYDADVEIWHADLYRLTSPDDVLELGLDGAFETAICLIEWPDRAADILPSDALRLDLSAQDSGRSVTLSGGRVGLIQTILANWQPDA